jgi:hypothetical protein
MLVMGDTSAKAGVLARAPQRSGMSQSPQLVVLAICSSLNGLRGTP